MAGDAARRSAECLLRGVGGSAVTLRLPAPAAMPAITDELGLATPEFQDVELSPVVFRKARQQLREDGARWELMVSAIAVAGVLGGAGVTDASDLFSGAFGVLSDGVLLEIVSASSSDIGGEPCVYRLVLRVPLAETL